MTGHGVLTITPRQARDAGSCTESYRTGMNSLRRTGRARLDTEVPIVEVLDVLGFGDALWAMGAIEATLTLRLFAADCAEHVLQLFEAAYPDDRRPREAIRVARLHVHGLASEHERDAAQAAAWDAARAAAGGAAWDAACDAAQAAFVPEAATRTTQSSGPAFVNLRISSTSGNTSPPLSR